MDTKSKTARQLRLEAELRENLKRRKEQARARRNPAADEGDGTEAEAAAPPEDEAL